MNSLGETNPKIQNTLNAKNVKEKLIIIIIRYLIIEKKKLNIKLFIIITDLITITKIWFDNRADRIISPSKEATEYIFISIPPGIICYIINIHKLTINL